MKKIEGTNGVIVEITEGNARKIYPIVEDDHILCKGQFYKIKKVNDYCKKEGCFCPAPIVKGINLNKKPYSYDMEFINGKSLDKFVFNDDKQIIRITIKILEGLQTWLDADVRHNDLHSSNGGNVIIDSKENIKIIDPIVSDTSNTSSKEYEIARCYGMIRRFIYPSISKTIKENFNNCFLSRSSIQKIEYDYDRWKDSIFYSENDIDNKEIKNGYENKDSANIVIRLKELNSTLPKSP